MPSPAAGSASRTPASASAQTADGIDRSVYPMPGFVTFTVADLARSTRWYVDGLGLVVLAELPARDATPPLVHLRRHRYQDVLLVVVGPPAEGSEALGRGVQYTVAAGREDLPSRADHARTVAAALPGAAVEGPSRTPWNTVDLVCTDSDGYRVVLTRPVAEQEVDHQWSERVRRSVRTRAPAVVPSPTRRPPALPDPVPAGWTPVGAPCRPLQPSLVMAEALLNGAPAAHARR